jgi:hypothetical protein
MSKSKILNPLAAKRKFVQSLTLQRYRKYVNDTNFLTPSKLTDVPKKTVPKKTVPKKTVPKKTVPKKTVTEKVQTVDKDQTVEEIRIAEDVVNVPERNFIEDSHLPVDQSIEVREDDSGESLTTFEFRRIISMLQTNQKKRKEKVPDWAKLAMASRYPNSDVEPY